MCTILSRPHSLPLILLGTSILVYCSKNPVTGKKEFAPYSKADEIALGNPHYRPLKPARGGAFSTDPSLAACVRPFGRRVAAASDRRTLPYEFVVADNGTPNAWALPGGRIAIDRSLLLKMENEARRPPCCPTRSHTPSPGPVKAPFALFPDGRPEIFARIFR